LAQVDPGKVKNAVRSNFDASTLEYDAFERHYGLFRDLTLGLARICRIGNGMSVWDVGCGTGASAFALAELVGDAGSVVGIDNSEGMLDAARCQDRANAEFVLADADDLGGIPYTAPDAVLYNASIFLIPAPGHTLGAAFEVLREGGVVGMNFLIGTTDEEGDVDLFLTAKNEGLDCAPYGRPIIDPDDLPGILEDTGFADILTGIVEIPMTVDKVRGFYAIPAQSAGLWPRTPYEERLRLLDSLLDHFEEGGVTGYVQRWGWCAAVK